MQLSGAASVWQAPGPEFHHWYKKKKGGFKNSNKNHF